MTYDCIFLTAKTAFFYFEGAFSGITPDYPTHHTLLGLGLGLGFGLGLWIGLGLG